MDRQALIYAEVRRALQRSRKRRRFTPVELVQLRAALEPVVVGQGAFVSIEVPEDPVDGGMDPIGPGGDDRPGNPTPPPPPSDTPPPATGGGRRGGGGVPGVTDAPPPGPVVVIGGGGGPNPTPSPGGLEPE
ncbi:MAG: hypothetical protein AAGJ54_05830 [Planctomycetota bacterium]